MMQRRQRPTYMITIVNTAPPIFVNTTQAEFRAVVQRLTGSSADLNNNNNNSNSQNLQYDHFTDLNVKVPSSQSEGRSTETPTIAASNRRRPRARAGVIPGRNASSGSSDSPCNTSGDAVARSVETTGKDHDYNSNSSSPKKIKLGISSHSEDHDSADLGQQQLADIHNAIDHGVHASNVSLLNIPEASSLSCTPSIAAAAAATTPSSSSSFRAHSPASLSAGSHIVFSGFPDIDAAGAAISGSTDILTAASYDDDDSLGRFYCDPESLPPLVDAMIGDELQQQLGLFPTFLYASSTANTPAHTVATSPPSPLHPSDAQWGILNTSFTWKEDDSLRI